MVRAIDAAIDVLERTAKPADTVPRLEPDLAAGALGTPEFMPRATTS